MKDKLLDTFMVVAILLGALTLYCLLKPANALGAPWQAWFISAILSWMVGHYLDRKVA